MDKNLKLVQGGQLEFAYQKDHLIVSKEYKGKIYSFNSNRDKIYKYDDTDHIWMLAF